MYFVIVKDKVGMGRGEWIREGGPSPGKVMTVVRLGKEARQAGRAEQDCLSLMAIMADGAIKPS